MLEDKIEAAKKIIKRYYDENNGNVFVSFSGGKDSTVLLHIARSVYPDIKGVYSNTIGFLAMQTNLKFSAGGLKNTRGEIILKSLDDSFSFRGGLYWSSGDPVKLNINSNITTSITIAEGRASGLSVRCIKN
jgi:hypothetical protein